MNREKWDRRLLSYIGDAGTKVPGLAALVYKDGREVYRFTAGCRRLDGNTLPMTVDSRFRIASVSKMFTVFTLLQLAEKGKLSLDDDVSQYLGFSLRHPAHPEIPLTLRLLAAHLSGLRDGRVYSIPPQVSVREFFIPDGRYWEDGQHFAPAAQVPGEYFTYSNLNYGLLGTVIEQVTGCRFDVYQKEHILKDLDTQADYLPGNLSAAAFANLGTVYQKRDAAGNWQENGSWRGIIDDFQGWRPPQDTVSLQNPYAAEVKQTYSLAGYHPGTNATPFSPQGGLRISLTELGHTLAMLLNEGVYQGRQVLAPASLQALFTPSWIYDGTNGDTCANTLLAYGLGTFFVDGQGPARCSSARICNLWGHTGQAFGLLSGLFLDRERKSGFAYILNGEAIPEDTDPRSLGSYSTNYRWEEQVMEVLCQLL